MRLPLVLTAIMLLVLPVQPAMSDPVKISVTGFHLVDKYGAIVALGRTAVTSAVEQQLGRFNNYLAVVDRSRLDVVLNELKLKDNNVTSDNSKEIGRLLGADFVCFVTCDSASLTEKLVDAKTDNNGNVTSRAYWSYKYQWTITVKFIEVTTGVVDSRTYQNSLTSNQQDASRWIALLDKSMMDMNEDLTNGKLLHEAKRLKRVPILQRGNNFVRIGFGKNNGITQNMEFDIVFDELVDGFTEQKVYGVATVKGDSIFEDNTKLEVKKYGKKKKGEDILANIPSNAYLSYQHVKLYERRGPNPVLEMLLNVKREDEEISYYSSKPITSIFR